MENGNASRGIGGHQRGHRGQRDEWLTPPQVIAALGPFDCDPCSPVNRPWDTATVHYTINDDGLAREWRGMVWCNPPYGPQTWVWLNKLAEHGNGLALIFARTETVGFFHEVWEKADALLFLESRLHFHYSTGERAAANSGAPSVLVAYGSEAVQRLRDSGLKGALVESWNRIR